jgi:hypothetical protein
MKNMVEAIDKQIEIVKKAYDACNKSHEQYYKGMYDGLCEFRRVVEFQTVTA